MPQRSAVKVHENDEGFVLALIENRFNGKKAAMDIGYSEGGATSAASRMLAKSNVQELLSQKLEEIRAGQNFTIRQMYEEWGRIAYSNMDDYTVQGEDGETYIQVPHGDRAKMAAIKSVETWETEHEDGSIVRRTKITLHDKLTGMDKLSRLFGMWDGKDPTVNVINGNVQFNDNRKVENKIVNIANVSPEEAAEAYRKLLGR